METRRGFEYMSDHDIIQENNEGQCISDYSLAINDNSYQTMNMFDLSSSTCLYVSYTSDNNKY